MYATSTEFNQVCLQFLDFFLLPWFSVYNFNILLLVLILFIKLNFLKEVSTTRGHIYTDWILKDPKYANYMLEITNKKIEKIKNMIINIYCNKMYQSKNLI
jgi:hypothetical protein